MLSAVVQWTEKMKFNASAMGKSVAIDARAPLGDGDGPNPKELVLMGIAGCTGMDVAALLKKHKQMASKIEIKCEADLTTGVHPAVFKTVRLFFVVEGNVDPGKLEEAVHLSQTQYCGVSAMIAKTCPITYKIELNGKVIKEGQSRFA